jgi:hypothetical protein
MKLGLAGASASCISPSSRPGWERFGTGGANYKLMGEFRFSPYYLILTAGPTEETNPDRAVRKSLFFLN